MVLIKNTNDKKPANRFGFPKNETSLSSPFVKLSNLSILKIKFVDKFSIPNKIPITAKAIIKFLKISSFFLFLLKISFAKI